MSELLVCVCLRVELQSKNVILRYFLLFSTKSLTVDDSVNKSL